MAPGQDPDLDRFALSFPAEPVWVGTARLFAASVARQVGCSEDAVEDLKLAISEACGVLVRAARDGEILQVALESSGERVDVEVVGGPPVPREVLEAEESTPDSFASQASLAVLRSLFADLDISPLPAATRLRFGFSVEE